MNCLIFNDSTAVLDKTEAKIEEYFNDVIITKCHDLDALLTLVSRIKFNCLLITLNRNYLQNIRLMTYIINHKADFSDTLISIDVSQADQLQAEFADHQQILFHQQSQSAEYSTECPYILIKNGKSVLKLPVCSILFAEVYYKTVNIITDTARYELKKHTLDEFKKRLPRNKFIQCHRSFIVNVNCIEAIRYSDHRRFICIGERMIPIGERYRKNVDII